jgi:lipid II:glycine glycyltransferase (peptidoglycan interpeptide bridge formation enzyme)
MGSSKQGRLGRQLRAGFTAEIDSVDEQEWYSLVARFADANIYQTWAYDEVRCGRKRISHLVLKKDGDVVAVAQARIVRLPFLCAGIAYVRWGPLWRLGNTDADPEVLEQILRALRNEYACRRRMVIRIYPALFDDSPAPWKAVLTEEGFSPVAGTCDRTLVMDIRPPLADLRAALRPHWQRELKVAEKRHLEVSEGVDDGFFESFVAIYKEMLDRKRFAEPNDIGEFRDIQRVSPPQFKMRVMLCRDGETLCAGAIYSVIGQTAIYLFGATSNNGMRSRGSYLLQWRVIEALQKAGVTFYDLNGINPAANPGTYKFKAELCGTGGKDVTLLGRFDAGVGGWSQWWVQAAGGLTRAYRLSMSVMSKRIGNRRPGKTAPPEPCSEAVSGSSMKVAAGD